MASPGNAPEPVIELRGVEKHYQMGDTLVKALHGVDLKILPGDYISILGPSGCGKSTMLNILGCLDQPTIGQYFLSGQDVSQLSDDDLSQVRGKRLGFIFQSYNLIQQLTVVENIEVPLYYQGVTEKESREIAVALAEKVGLGTRLDHRPTELSGGQQQRVAIARALANDPAVILADEATGNLDSKSGGDILQIFDELNADGKTLILITHDEGMAMRTSRTIRLKDGSVAYDSYTERQLA
ncbi:MAG: ABC transporter ATP-binding protein [Verrucomicrobiales bacterium]|jgi:putative ABC transport system ATP-binding protein|nr:ABC transporter ATP-binding protein [Verrucomicrobiales bacterium]MDP4793561.1 ABC transporter ATP-binding protein [Verrucomicrobiales bacterium]MDP4939773.1 ABC transporter ATP-binding protein [Verrucomicrobiales bacterium]MDP5004779.1 ABC transporter ATP-binding protein [Verrucomicrobiales bacterium]